MVKDLGAEEFPMRAADGPQVSALGRRCKRGGPVQAYHRAKVMTLRVVFRTSFTIRLLLKVSVVDVTESSRST